MKSPKIKSIRSRLTFWYLLIVGLILLITDVMVYRTIKSNLGQSIDDTLFTVAREIRLSMQQSSPEEWRSNIVNVKEEVLTNRFFTQILQLALGAEDEYLRITRSEVLNRCQYPGKGQPLLRQLAPDQSLLINANDPGLSDHPIRILFYPIDLPSGRYLIQVGTSLKRIHQVLGNLLMVLLATGPVMLLLSSIGGYLILSRVINPVREITAAARRITTRDLSHRIELKAGEDEIGELIRTFNQMISRLDKSVGQIKQFSSDVSHELKTPLTTILGEIELAGKRARSVDYYRSTMSNLHREAKRLGHLVDNLLFLSNIDFMHQIFPFQSTSLHELLLESLKKIQPSVRSKRLTVSLKEARLFFIRGNPTLLSLMVNNLLDNAVKYTPPGGSIQISLSRDPRWGVFRVTDSGIGIPSKALPLVFNRFYRVDQSRSSTVQGFGLGLSLVKRVCDLHGAEIGIKSTPGKGTDIQVCFPLQPTGESVHTKSFSENG